TAQRVHTMIIPRSFTITTKAIIICDNVKLPRSAIDAFIRGRRRHHGPSRCVSMSTPLSVLPNGDVATCMLFPEFTVGNPHDDELDTIWNVPVPMRTRETLSRGLTPTCSRCVRLYPNRPTLN